MSTPPTGKTPPQDLEAEASVLGAILLDATVMARVLPLLDVEDFYRENNGLIYDGACRLFREGHPIDNVMLAGELTKMGVLERVGGRAQLATLHESVPTAANAEHYALIVQRLALKRRLIATGTEVSGLGYDEGLDADDAVNDAQARIYALTRDRGGSNMELLFNLLKPAMDRIDAQMQNGTGLLGLPTGFTDLDRMLGGLQEDAFIIVAARPSMGKTSLVTNIARHVASTQKVPVAFFSLEMSQQQLVERLLCEEARIDSQRLHRGMLNEGEYDRLTAALGPLGDAPIHIDDTPALDDLTLQLKARQAKSRHGIGLIIIDYIQLMHSRGRQKDEVNRVQEVSAISRTLKAIARELRVPVLAISQLSRAPEARTDKRPILSDLRESGSLEQDCDVAALLYRDDYYNRDKSEKPGIAEVMVAKNRSGPTGTVELTFRRELTRFENLAKRHSRLGDGGD
jgi:replicative DNA helicase